MGVLIDSNVLLDVMIEDARWFGWSSEAIARCAEASALLINPIVYAEVSIRFETIEELEEALPKGVFERRDIPWKAAFLAGKSFVKYRRAGGIKTAPLPDFFIGRIFPRPGGGRSVRSYSLSGICRPGFDDCLLPTSPASSPRVR
jgi:predicted nucleic acid-binding protein